MQTEKQNCKGNKKTKKTRNVEYVVDKITILSFFSIAHAHKTVRAGKQNKHSTAQNGNARKQTNKHKRTGKQSKKTKNENKKKHNLPSTCKNTQKNNHKNTKHATCSRINAIFEAECANTIFTIEKSCQSSQNTHKISKIRKNLRQNCRNNKQSHET